MAKNLPLLKNLAVAAVVTLVTTLSAIAQQPFTGRWTATIYDEPSRINLNFERRTERGGRSQNGQTYDYSDLQGLTAEQARGSGFVKFSLVREAGRIDCEGNFQNGKGAGTFVFTGNPSFVAALKSRGFDLEKHSGLNHPPDIDDRLFVATTLNITTALADDLVSTGFPNLDVDDLFKAAIFKVDSKFMREMKATGFDLGMEDLVKARIFKVDPAFASAVRDMGFANESFDSLVKMKIFKVTPEFVTEMRNEGLSSITIEDLVKLRIFKIDREFIRQSKADGVPLDVERLVQRRIGVR